MALLSISSRVADGTVGNSQIERGAHTADPTARVLTLNTVDWTAAGNHPARCGRVTPAAVLAEMLASLLDPQWDFSITTALTGYFRQADQVHAVANRLCKEKQGALRHLVVDPVCGEGGKLFVPGDVATALREELCPLADVLLPNWTEACFLAGLPTETPADDLCRTLLGQYPGLKTLVITSATTPDSPGMIGCLLAPRGEAPTWHLHPHYPGQYHGLGDYLSGWIAATMDGSGNWAGRVGECVNLLQAQLRR